MTSAFARTERLGCWGRTATFEGPVARPRFAGDLPTIFADPHRPTTILAHGLGRSYGDSCLNTGGGMVCMRGLDRILQLDPAGRVLRAQAGMTLDEALAILTPKGLFIPVLPGTRHVTLGGAVANDVHGKNHTTHGSFGRWVRRIGLVRSDRGAIQISPDDPEGLFAATIGGMGLTGLISWVEIALTQIQSTDLIVEDIAFETFEEYYELMVNHGDSDYRVAWIDCTRPGYGIFTHATHAPIGETQPRPRDKAFAVPFDMPGFLLNGATLSLFNRAYRALKRRRHGPRRAHYSTFHFPLDGVRDWNRLYGERGFRQYQCVIPDAAARETMWEILRVIGKAGDGSFLAVMKQFGRLPRPGLLSFPREGVTLALDFRHRGQRTLDLLHTLDEIVLSAGGRIYPAKDGRVSANHFQFMYPEWRELEARRDPAIQSSFWKRVTRA